MAKKRTHVNNITTEACEQVAIMLLEEDDTNTQ